MKTFGEWCANVLVNLFLSLVAGRVLGFVLTPLSYNRRVVLCLTVLWGLEYAIAEGVTLASRQLEKTRTTRAIE